MRNFKTIFLLVSFVAALTVTNVLLCRNDIVSMTADRFSLVDSSLGVRGIRICRKSKPDTLISRVDGSWRLTSPYAAIADEQVVMRLIDRLCQDPLADVLSDRELLKLGRTHADFHLDDADLSLTLESESGKISRYSFGITTPAKDGVYVAVEGIDAVFIVNTNLVAAFDLPADNFRRRSLFPSGTDGITTFEIKREATSVLEFSRRDEGWNMGDKRAAGQKVSKFLSDLAAASATSFVWPVGASNEADHVSASLLAGYGLDPESAVTVTLNASCGATSRVVFGKESGDGQVYALVQNGDAIVTVSSALRDFVTQDALLFVDARVFPVDVRSVDNFSVADGAVRYSLAKGKDGLWRLESPIVAAADQPSVDAVLARILALSSYDVVKTNGVSVSISTNLPTVMVSGQRVLADLKYESLRSKEILRIDPAVVRRLVCLTGGEGQKPVSAVYERTRRVWQVENADSQVRVNVKGVEAILAALNPLKAVSVAKLSVHADALTEYGLDKPFLTVAIDVNAEGSVRRNVMIGKKTKGGRYATVGSSDAVFIISNAAVSGLSQAIVVK